MYGDASDTFEIRRILDESGAFNTIAEELRLAVERSPEFAKLRERTEASTKGLLAKQKWDANLNKHELREGLRLLTLGDGAVTKSIDDMLEAHIPKIESIMETVMEKLLEQNCQKEIMQHYSYATCGIGGTLYGQNTPMAGHQWPYNSMGCGPVQPNAGCSDQAFGTRQMPCMTTPNPSPFSHNAPSLLSTERAQLDSLFQSQMKATMSFIDSHVKSAFGNCQPLEHSFVRPGAESITDERRSDDRPSLGQHHFSQNLPQPATQLTPPAVRFGEPSGSVQQCDKPPNLANNNVSSSKCTESVVSKCPDRSDPHKTTKSERVEEAIRRMQRVEGQRSRCHQLSCEIMSPASGETKQGETAARSSIKLKIRRINPVSISNEDGCDQRLQNIVGSKGDERSLPKESFQQMKGSESGILTSDHPRPSNHSNAEPSSTCPSKALEAKPVVQKTKVNAVRERNPAQSSLTKCDAIKTSQSDGIRRSSRRNIKNSRYYGGDYTTFSDSDSEKDTRKSRRTRKDSVALSRCSEPACPVLPDDYLDGSPLRVNSGVLSTPSPKKDLRERCEDVAIASRQPLLAAVAHSEACSPSKQRRNRSRKHNTDAIPEEMAAEKGSVHVECSPTGDCEMAVEGSVGMEEPVHHEGHSLAVTRLSDRGFLPINKAYQSSLTLHPPRQARNRRLWEIYMTRKRKGIRKTFIDNEFRKVRGNVVSLAPKGSEEVGGPIDGTRRGVSDDGSVDCHDCVTPTEMDGFGLCRVDQSSTVLETCSPPSLTECRQCIHTLIERVHSELDPVLEGLGRNDLTSPDMDKSHIGCLHVVCDKTVARTLDAARADDESFCDARAALEEIVHTLCRDYCFVEGSFVEGTDVTANVGFDGNAEDDLSSFCEESIAPPSGGAERVHCLRSLSDDATIPVDAVDDPLECPEVVGQEEGMYGLPNPDLSNDGLIALCENALMDILERTRLNQRDLSDDALSTDVCAGDQCNIENLQFASSSSIEATLVIRGLLANAVFADGVSPGRPWDDSVLTGENEALDNAAAGGAFEHEGNRGWGSEHPVWLGVKQPESVNASDDRSIRSGNGVSILNEGMVCEIDRSNAAGEHIPRDGGAQPALQSEEYVASCISCPMHGDRLPSDPSNDDFEDKHSSTPTCSIDASTDECPVADTQTTPCSIAEEFALVWDKNVELANQNASTALVLDSGVGETPSTTDSCDRQSLRPYITRSKTANARAKSKADRTKKSNKKRNRDTRSREDCVLWRPNLRDTCEEQSEPLNSTCRRKKRKY